MKPVVSWPFHCCLQGLAVSPAGASCPLGAGCVLGNEVWGFGGEGVGKKASSVLGNVLRVWPIWRKAGT